MRYFALATDYDDTLASSGKVASNATDALVRLNSSGRRSLLVTGRHLEDLQHAFPPLDLFEYAVVENGAVLFNPRSREVRLLSEPLSEKLIAEFRNIKVEPLHIGRVIAATLTSEKFKVLEAIQKLGLEAQIIFNGNSMMVLPPGINKATGTAYALRKMGLSFHELVGIGDSENDYSLLRHCEFAVAVANAVPAIKDICVYVTRGGPGEGVVELIDELIETDLELFAPKLTKNHIALGKRLDGRPVWIPSYGQNLLIAGPPGSGKTSFATGLIERIHSRGYQLCIIDPEGDYGTLEEIVSIGSHRRTPETDEIIKLLEDPKVSLSINLLGVPLLDRPAFFAHLLPALNALRAKTSRPHWIIMDEAHHLLPRTSGTAPLALPAKLGETVLLTVHPEQMARSALQLVDTVIAVGAHPNETLAEFSRAAGRSFSGPLVLPDRKDDVITWLYKGGQDPFVMQTLPGHTERIRHIRKYAQGDLGRNSFYFRGPEKRLNIKAQNLALFIQISEGLDETTWAYHLKNGDYARWFRENIKDDLIADEIKRMELRTDLNSNEARTLLCELIHLRYTV